MTSHVITPSTRAKRDKSINGQHTDYAHWVEGLQNNKHLNALQLMRRIKVGQRRIAKLKNLSPKEIFRRQSLFLNKQTGYLTDAFIERSVTFKKYNALSPKERSQLYSEIFSKVMDSIVLPRVTNPELKATMEKVDLYFMLPENIHQRRSNPERWQRLKTIRNNIINSKENPRENLLKAIDNVIQKKKSGDNYSTKAMDICETASVYADVMKQYGNKLWTTAYRDAMEIIYPKISLDDKLLDAIINLSRTNPSKYKITHLADKYFI
jgi:hypothetical protein